MSKWSRFNKWYIENGGSWKDQQEKIEQLFPLRNWKQVWKMFNYITNYLHKFTKYNNWEHERYILNFLIKEYGEKNEIVEYSSKIS